MSVYDLPDAPWIEEAGTDGFGGTDTPYEKAGDQELLDGADEGYGWKILAWRLGIDVDDVPVDDDFQSVWLNLPRSIRTAYLKLFRRSTNGLLKEYYEQWHELKNNN